MNISKIIAAGALATGMAFAQEDAWPADEPAEEQVAEQADDSAAQQDEAAPAEESAEQSSAEQASAEQASEPEPQAPAPQPTSETSSPAYANDAPVASEPREANTINSKMGFGLHANFNYSFLNGLAQDWNMGDEEEAPAGIGFNGGIRLRIPMVDFLQFTPEINFHYAELIQEDESAKRRFKQTDLEIPVMMRGVIMDLFYVAAGVQFTLNLNSEVTFEEADLQIGGGLGTLRMDLEENIEQAGFTFGIAFGAGAIINDRFSIDFGFVLGLTDMYPKCESDLIESMDGGKQITIKAGVGFWIM
jgi:hypothetical protein